MVVRQRSLISVTRTGRPCTVCSHKDINEIDRLLVVPGMNMSEIARLFSLHPRNISRHASLHLSKILRKAAAQDFEVSELARGADLLDQVAVLKDRAKGILDEAERIKDLDAALKGIREARACIETMAKLTGQLDRGTTINMFHQPGWINVQTNILAALSDHPDAYSAVLAALEHSRVEH